RRLGRPHVHDRAPDGHADRLRRGEHDGRDPLDDPDLRLDRDGDDGPARVQDAAPLHRRLHRLLRRRRALGDHVRGDPVRPGDDGHLLRRRPLPLHHLRGGRLPDPRRDVLLVPEGHGPAVQRAAGEGVLLAHLRRHEPDLLPDAHRRPARDAAARLHLPAAPRLGRLQPLGDDRGLRPHRRRARARGGSRDARLDGARRLPRRRARDALRVGVADHARALRDARLRDAPDRALRRRRDLRRARRAGAGGLALAGTGGVAAEDAAHSPRIWLVPSLRSGKGFGLVSSLPGSLRTGGGYAARRPQPVAHPNGWWGMAIFVAAEATLFGALLGTYFYLRFKVVHWPPGGAPAPKVALPLILAAVLVATSLPMQAALRAARSGR